MKRLILVLNGKGGVGKSFFSTQFIQFLKDRGLPHKAFDSDNENSTLKRFHPDAEFLSLGDPRGLDPLILALQSTPLVLTDTRAASSEVFLDFLDRLRVFEILEELGAELTLAIPVGGELDSIEHIQRISSHLEARCRYVLVRNEVFGSSLNLFAASKVRQHLINHLGAAEISMPAMAPWLVAILNLHGLTPTTAMTHPEINLLDRQRLKVWQRTFATELEKASPLLLASSNPPEEVQS